MIKYKNGKVDNRDIYQIEYDIYENLLVKVYDECENKFVTVKIGTYCSDGYLEPIRGDHYSKFVNFPSDVNINNNKRSLEELNNLFIRQRFEARKNRIGSAEKGDILEVIKGRSGKGTKFTVHYITTHEVRGTYGKIYYTYVKGRDEENNWVSYLLDNCQLIGNKYIK